MTEITNGKGRKAKPFMTAKGADAGAVWQSNRDDSAPAGLVEPTKPRRARPPNPRRKWRASRLYRAAADESHWRSRRWARGGPTRSSSTATACSCAPSAARPRLLTRKGLDWSKSSRDRRLWRGPGRRDHRWRGGGARPHRSAGLRRPPGSHLRRKTKDLVFFVFDQMFDGKEDLRPLPLVRSQGALQSRVDGRARQYPLCRSLHHRGRGGAAIGLSHGLEGIVSKKLDAPYQSGRSESWGKSKCRQGHEVVIGGWTTTGEAFRSLIAGVNRDGELVHVGRIGTGFGRATVDRIMPRLKALETDEPVQGQGRAEEGGGRPLGQAGAGRRDRIRRLHRRRLDPAGLLQGPAGGQAGPGVEAETPAPAATTELAEPGPVTVRTKDRDPARVRAGHGGHYLARRQAALAGRRRWTSR
jgi:bifunctional non-homologous end joining protein LigD